MADRLIPYFVRTIDYDQAGEDALAVTLSGASENSVFIYNTTLSKTRYWNGSTNSHVHLSAQLQLRNA